MAICSVDGGYLKFILFGIKISLNMKENILFSRLNNNKVILNCPGGKSREILFYPRGLKIYFEGKNATVKLDKKSRYFDAIMKVGENANVEIRRTKKMGISKTVLEIGKNSNLFIDEDFNIVSGFVSATGGCSVKIGKECMFSENVCIRTADGHAIFDSTTGTLQNPARDVNIGDRVWLARGATVLKGADIANDCVVGTCSVVTSSVKESGVVLAGIPAKIVKRNVRWEI